MTHKRMYGVECTQPDTDTTVMEIFETPEDAVQCFNKERGIYIFSAMFDEELIYKEDTGEWNYEDCNGLFTGFNIHVIKRAGHTERNIKEFLK